MDFITERPSGFVDGVNKVFALSRTPTAPTVFMNGLAQAPYFDFNIYNNEISFIIPPPSGSKIEAIYIPAPPIFFRDKTRTPEGWYQTPTRLRFHGRA